MAKIDTFLARGIDRRSFLAAGLGLLVAGPATANLHSRIVAAGSDVTETLARLEGLGVLCGVDTTSRVPPEVRKLPSIGYLRQISLEGIVSLKPDLVIANGDLGPQAVIDQLRGLGVRVELVGAPPTAAGMAAKVRRIGAILAREAPAESLANELETIMAQLAARLAGLDQRPRLAFLRSLDGGRPIAAGKLPLVDAAFDLVGGVNAFTDFSLFKTVSKEVLAASPPDVIVADAETVTAAGGAAAFMGELGLGDAFASNPKRLAAIDAATLFAFGPSGATALTALAQQIHPERFAGSTP